MHYANDMIRHLSFALLLLPGIAQAVICKTVDPEGGVSYADIPAAECPQAVKLPDFSTYTPRPVQAPAESGDAATAKPEPFERYASISILQPEADGIVRSNEGVVPVSIALEPTLQPGHRVTLYVDGQAVPGSFDGLAIELSGIERGTHNLQARISDAAGKVLIESSGIRFTLRQTGLFDRAPPPPPPSPPPAKPG